MLNVSFNLFLLFFLVQFCCEFTLNRPVELLYIYFIFIFDSVMAAEDVLSEPFESYITQDAIQHGLKAGIYLQGVFQASRFVIIHFCNIICLIKVN